MDYLRNVFGRKQIKFLIISGISLLVGLIILLVGVRLSKGMKFENMASRWGDKKEFAQVSVFLSELAEYDENSINGLVYNTEKKLKEDSITAENNARLFIYAFSSIGKVSVTSETANLSAKAIGVGGDFFLFHPLDLIAGSTFDSDNINDDLIVIDRETAFSLFGSVNVVGMTVDINGKAYIVSGVVERDKGRLNELSGNNEAIVYLSYSSIKGSGMHINMYETLMPNPISNYASDVVKQYVGTDEKYYEIVENTGRFYFTKLLKNATRFGTRSMNSKGIVYPYWENMARGMEDYLTPLAVLGLILFAIPSLCVFYMVLRIWKLRTIHMGEIKDFFERLGEKSRENQRKARDKKSKKPKKEKPLNKKKKEKTKEESEDTETEEFDETEEQEEIANEAAKEIEEPVEIDETQTFSELNEDSSDNYEESEQDFSNKVVVPKLSSQAAEPSKRKKKRRK